MKRKEYSLGDLTEIAEMILESLDGRNVIVFRGEMGAGKTTLIKLLIRLYDATNGEILYNGRNITEYAPNKYREHIGVVFQDYKIFAATIGENVMGGNILKRMKKL